MLKSTVIPKVAAANHTHTVAHVHDKNEDHQTPVSLNDFDVLSPFARAAFDRLLGKAKEPQ